VRFAGFAGVWTIIGTGTELQPGKMLPLTVADERIVLFRDAHGRAAGLIDECPHRGVALSLGKLCNGVVECPFHGWRFDATGANVHVPWNPDAKLDRLGALSVPVREAGGLLWLYTGFAPAEEPQPSETLMQPRVVVAAQSAIWRTHWTRAMENMLDSPHLPFVHRATIGRFVAPHLPGRMDIEWVPTPYGARIESRIEQRPAASRLDYRFPNTMELFIDPPGKTLRMLAICLPIDDAHTRLTIITVRDFARSPLLNPIFRRSNRKIAREDQAVLESSLPPEVPPAGSEKSVRTDKPTLAFRKIYFERLKDSTAHVPTS
jgi:phenylpropionate dioxygenase-like ring-hydroxylating dioxygenase large terminal subunit